MSYRNPPRHIAAGALRAEMARNRKTSNDLAAVLNCSPTTAQRLMSGESCLDLDRIEAIAEWLDIPMSVLLPGILAVAA